MCGARHGQRKCTKRLDHIMHFIVVCHSLDFATAIWSTLAVHGYEPKTQRTDTPGERGWITCTPGQKPMRSRIDGSSRARRTWDLELKTGRSPHSRRLRLSRAAIGCASASLGITGWLLPLSLLRPASAVLFTFMFLIATLSAVVPV